MDMMGGCEYCGSAHNLQRCSKCKTALYCSREHQKAHWREHRLSCGEQRLSSQLLSRTTDNSIFHNLQLDQASLQHQPRSGASLIDYGSQPNIGSASFDISSNSYINDNSPNLVTADDYLRFVDPTNIGSGVQRLETVNSELAQSAFTTWSDRLSSEQYLPSSAFSNGIGQRVNAQQAYPSLSSSTSPIASIVKISHSENNSAFASDYTDLPCQATGYTPPHMELKKKLKLSEPEVVPYLHRNMRIVPGDIPHINNQSLINTMCHYVISDMDKYGICVIDDFLGKSLGKSVLHEVKEMYRRGQFADGQLMSNPTGNSSRTIRGDKILWVNGNEEYAYNIGLLIKYVDMIVCRSNRMPNNGKMGEYTISDRSKAMIACYPGCGTQYVKHVDNPNKDGRCITSIYYLNENWDTKKDGGLLRIFPQESHQVADIEPLFDRMLFFWSDRRNPHEVQPSLRTRYAITLWYNDKSEKTAFRQQRELGHAIGPQSPGASPEI